MGDWAGQIFASRGIILPGTDVQHRQLGGDGRTLVTVEERVRPTWYGQGWLVTDAAGHEHTFGTVRSRYPALVRVTDGRGEPCEECGGEIVFYHLQCADCGETIWPSVAGPATEILPLKNRTRYVLDGVEISPDEAAVYLLDQAIS